MLRHRGLLARDLSRLLWPLGAVVISLAASALGVMTQVPILVVGGVVALAALVVWPTASLVVALIVCQEISDVSGFGSNASPFQVFGNSLYLEEVGRVSILVMTCLLAAFAGLLHTLPKRTGRERVPLGPVLLLALFGLVVVSISYIHLPSVFTVVNQYGRPYVLAIAALVLAGTTERQPGGWPAVVRTSSVTLVVVAVVGAILFVTGRVAPESDGSVAVFYDSALPAFAGAVFLAAVLGLVRGRWRWVMLLSTGVIVVLSGRRNVWVALIAALIIFLIVRRGRIRAMLRVGALLGALIAVIMLISPSLAQAAGDRLLAGLTAVSGSTADQSTTGHIDDVRYGLYYAIRDPVLGLGPNHPPLPGMAVQGSDFYVHNSYLLDWLRFGIPGLLVASTLGVGMFLVGARALRREESSVYATVSALFLLVAPICAMTAAFFNATQRWPALLGLAAGAVLAARRGETAGSGKRPLSLATAPQESPVRAAIGAEG